MFGGGFPGFFGGGGHFEEEGEQMDKEVDNTEFYKILGVDQKASIDEIKKAFKKACVKGDYRHPDKGGDPEKFKLLNEAASVLCDSEKREVYDKYGKEGLKEGGGGHRGSPFDFFSQMFGEERGQRGGGKQKAKGKLKELQVTLEDVYKGKMITFDFTRKRCCAACDGKGGADVKKCPTCKGRRIVEKMVMLGPGMYSHSQQPCNECKGEGEICDPKTRCKTCKGNKIVDNTKTIEVSLQPGVPHEHDYVLTGEADEAPDIMPGDLHVRIMIKKHATFTRKGADLFIEKKITLLEALTGVQFEVKHLDGSKINIASPPGDIISSNAIKVIKGKGMPFYKDSFGHGNLYVKFEVQFPKQGELTNDKVEQLKKILPGPKQKPLDKSGNFEYMDEFNEADMNPSAEGGSKQSRDEDDERHHGGQQRVQCQQQ